MSGRYFDEWPLFANLGYDRLVKPAPAFIGDTLRAASEVAELQESRSRPNAGIVTFAHTMTNQRDVIVSRCARRALLVKRPA